ncbi:MAG: FISUMP domain-containing protein [Bacteroidota bacterium]
MKKNFFLLLFIFLLKYVSAIPCSVAYGYTLTVTNLTGTSIQVTGNFGGFLTACTSNDLTSGCVVSSAPFSGNYTISNLIPNTTYYIYVINTPGTCGQSTSAKTLSCSCAGAGDKPNAPTIAIANCKLVKVNWTLNPCAKNYVLEIGPVSNPNFPSVIDVGKNSTYSVVPTPTGYSFPAGTYKCRIKYRYDDCSSTNKWSVYSDLTNFTISNTPADAGPDKSIPQCPNGTKVQLQATPLSGASWSVVSSNPSGNFGYFDDKNNPNTYFYNTGAISYTLKWGNGCSNDIMIVYTSFQCGTDITDSRDSKVYPTVLINGKCWFKKNLNYGTQIPWGGGKPAYYKNPASVTDDASWPASNSNIVKYCLNNNASNCTAFGGLYLGDVAALSGLCPPCWHVASDNEWTGLANYAASTPTSGNAATRLKDNTLGFNAIPGTNSSAANPDGFLTTGFVTTIIVYQTVQGYGLNGVNSFNPITNPVQSGNWNGAFDFHSTGKVALYWTSTYGGAMSYGLYPTRYDATRGGQAWYRRFTAAGSVFSQNNDAIYRELVPRREFALHVRCVKD